MKDEIKLKDMTDFLENVYKDIKKQPTLEEELEKERKFINKIKGDNEDELKEILDILNRMAKENKESDNPLQATVILFEILYKVLDYITNLQEKINQYENPDDLTLFYMWLDEKAKDKMKHLQQENEYLKMNNPEQNMEHFKIINENKRKINNLREQNIDLRKENERLKDIVVEKDSQIKEMILQKTDYTAVNILEMKLEDYKSRIEKAVEYIGKPLDNYWEEEAQYLLNLLNGDEDE